jgi:hypothetical protein
VVGGDGSKRGRDWAVPSSASISSIRFRRSSTAASSTVPQYATTTSESTKTSPHPRVVYASGTYSEKTTTFRGRK